jgi:hypothetical protein
MRPIAIQSKRGIAPETGAREARLLPAPHSFWIPRMQGNFAKRPFAPAKLAIEMVPNQSLGTEIPRISEQRNCSGIAGEPAEEISAICGPSRELAGNRHEPGAGDHLQARTGKAVPFVSEGLCPVLTALGS